MQPGDVLSYLEMCTAEGVNLQRGMNYHLRGNISVILMSLRRDAPYADRIEEEGRVLIYEGHDVPRLRDGLKPKTVDQPMNNPDGGLTQNGLFYDAAMKYKARQANAELVKVYEKVRPGLWVFNGMFRLIDAWLETSNARNIFKFKLQITEAVELDAHSSDGEIDHSRLIPASVKLEVWKRDRGQCVQCSSRDNLHFDHIIPYSKGGSSLVAQNIQLLCARHNLQKRDRIM